MGYNPRLNPMIAGNDSGFGSVATDGSAASALFSPLRAGQVLGARFVNGNTATSASGTAPATITVYKNAINAGSIIASADVGDLAVLADQDLTLSTSTSLTRFSDGDVFLTQLVGGASNDNSNAGAFVEVSYMYAHTDD